MKPRLASGLERSNRSILGIDVVSETLCRFEPANAEGIDGPNFVRILNDSVRYGLLGLR
jgi:hypothetical protein